MTTTHPTLQFANAFDLLEEEHLALKSKLTEFQLIYDVINQGRQDTDWYGTLRNLRERVLTFIEQLDRHSEWEDEILFPTVVLYSGQSRAAIDLVEEDHVLAMQYLRGFIDQLDKYVAPIQRTQAKRLTALLMEAHDLLLDHFRKEEQLIFPIAEHIKTDIDYLSC